MADVPQNTDVVPEVTTPAPPEGDDGLYTQVMPSDLVELEEIEIPQSDVTSEFEGEGGEGWGKGRMNADGSIEIPQIKTPGWQAGDEILNSSQESIFEAARTSVGKEMWNFGPNAKYTMEGRLGGATSAAHVAELAGYPGLEDASVIGLTRELEEKYNFKEKPLAQAKPGDFIIDRERHRMGIMGKNGMMYGMRRGGVWGEYPMTQSPTARAYSQNGL